jgi:CsoR family transcriptional regulator, copper-sensing transcriptional repressor
VKIQDRDTRDDLIRRLKRIEGQVRGVEQMLDDERDCKEIMQQLTAIHSAVQSTSRIFLQDYATTCIMEMDQEAGDAPESTIQSKRKKMIQDMLQMLDKTP